MIQLSDPAWRPAIEQFAQNYLNSRIMLDMDVEESIRDFAFFGETSPGILDWITAHSNQIYHHRFPYDNDFIFHLNQHDSHPFKTWEEHQKWLKAGNIYIGVNPDSPAVQAAIKEALA